ncbi:MAG: class I SAM-dependent methyltransferase [Solirubrobacteraceae bacterium]
MSSPQPSLSGWRSPEVAGSYLESRETVIPMLDVMEDLVRVLLARAPRPVARFLDLGCGGGAMSELVRSVSPSAEAVLVDFSETMLAQARRRGEGEQGWQVLCGDLAGTGWREALPPGRYDAVVSGLAIHHLSPQRKRALFAEIHDLLEPGGMFVNVDYVTQHGPLAGLWDEEMLAAAVRADHAHGGERSDDEVEGDLFDDSGEDRPDTAEDQLAWLRRAGFDPADLYFKWAEAAVFGGIRAA